MTRRGIAEWVFWLVALAPVLAVLLVPVLVLQDGGLHLSSATALGQLLRGEFPDVLQWRPGLPPNTTAELVMLGLLRVLDPDWALRVFTGAILIGYALAARRMVSAAGAAAPWAVLLLPFAWNRSLAWGFLDYEAAVVLAMLAIALVLRRASRPPVVALGGLLLLTWLTHLVPALIAVAVCVTVAVTAGFINRAGRDGRPWYAGVVRVLLASSPVLVLSAVFAASTDSGSYWPRAESLVSRLMGVVGMTRGDVSTVQVEYDAYRLVALILYIAAASLLVVRIRRGWHLRVGDALLVSAIAGVLVILVVPEGVDGGGGFLATRMSVWPCILLAAWVAADLGQLPRPVGLVRLTMLASVPLALAVVSLVLVGARLPTQRALGRQVAEIRTLTPCMPQRSTVVQLSLDDSRSQVVELFPLSEQVGFIAADRDGLDMGNEAGWVPYYLWRYRSQQDASQVLGTEPNGVFDIPPRMDLDGALRRGLHLDAVVVVGRPHATAAVLADGPTRTTLADLGHDYTRVKVSRTDMAELWLRRGMAPSCS